MQIFSYFGQRQDRNKNNLRKTPKISEIIKVSEIIVQTVLAFPTLNDGNLNRVNWKDSKTF